MCNNWATAILNTVLKTMRIYDIAPEKVEIGTAPDTVTSVKFSWGGMSKDMKTK
jgi:hypothetical protein